MVTINYPGVDAHLNSFMQQPDAAWDSFHARLIVELANSIDALLPDNYYVLEERSMQTHIYASDAQRTQRTRPDVTVFTTGPGPGPRSVARAVASPTVAFPIADALEAEEAEVMAVTVYAVEAGQMPGKPVTRLELLSPANKPPHRYHQQYLARRNEALRGGLRLVEIDLLHESVPLLAPIPSYRDAEADAYPYMIILSDPLPDIAAPDSTKVYGVGILDPLPRLAIPLSVADSITLNFNALYQSVIRSRKAFRLLVDYGAQPVNVERYSVQDQAALRAFLSEARQSW